MTVKNAYVTFRSMEGYFRAKNVFTQSLPARCWLKCTCRGSRYREKLFENKYLKVSSAMDPSLILWENLGYSQQARTVRVAVTSFIAFLLLVICSLINLYGADSDESIQSFSPQV